MAANFVDFDKLVVGQRYRVTFPPPGNRIFIGTVIDPPYWLTQEDKDFAERFAQYGYLVPLRNRVDHVRFKPDDMDIQIIPIHPDITFERIAGGGRRLSRKSRKSKKSRKSRKSKKSKRSKN